MITTLMILVFVLGYLALALEHPLKIDKAASALLIGGVCWALYAFSGISHHDLTHEIKFDHQFYVQMRDFQINKDRLMRKTQYSRAFLLN